MDTSKKRRNITRIECILLRACSRSPLFFLFHDNWKSHCKICDSKCVCMIIMKFRFKMQKLVVLLRAGHDMCGIHNTYIFCYFLSPKTTAPNLNILHRIATPRIASRVHNTHIDMELYNHDVINSLAFDMHFERIRKKSDSIVYCNADAAFRINFGLGLRFYYYFMHFTLYTHM